MNFSDSVDALQLDIAETLRMLQEQLQQMDVLKEQALQYVVTNDLISTDNMHTLEFLNCTAVELTKIASRQRQLLIQRRRTKNIVTWCDQNQEWAHAMLKSFQKYICPTSKKFTYNYRTFEAYDLATSLDEDLTRLNANVAKPSGATTEFHRSRVEKAVVSNLKHGMPKSKASSVTMPVPQYIPLNKKTETITKQEFLKRTHNLNMTNLPPVYTHMRFGIAKLHSSFVIYDLDEKVLMFQSLRLTALFGFMKEHNIDLTQLCCHPFYFPTIAHYINDSLRIGKNGTLDLPYIKEVATKAFHYSG